MQEDTKLKTPPEIDSTPTETRVKLSEAELVSLTKEEWAQKWLNMEKYVDHLEEKTAHMEVELSSLKSSEERLRQHNVELNHRERILIRRIGGKDQELQDCMNQIAELKTGQAPSAVALRSTLLDPAVNLLLHRLRQEVTTIKTKLEETQNELSAWKFTPDSNTGKRLMAKCRLLYQENEELGRIVSSGRLAKLEGDLALQKSFSEEVKKSQSELDEFLQDLDEDVEGMQSTIYYLQQELRKAKENTTDNSNNQQCDELNRTTEFRTNVCVVNGTSETVKTNGRTTEETSSDEECNQSNKRTLSGGEERTVLVKRTRPNSQDEVITNGDNTKLADD